MSSWQPGAAALAPAGPLMTAANEYSQRVAQVCTRSTAAWVNACSNHCAEQTRHWNELSTRLMGVKVERKA
jgi:hypothetical protein